MNAKNECSAERWVPIPGYEGMYEVSDLGRVRSLPRVITTKRGERRLSGQMLAPGINGHGYLQVSLCGKSSTVHRLVLLAFVGPRPEGLVSRHLNGLKEDLRLENLSYGTQSENILDKVAHGTHNDARKTHCIKGHPFSGENLQFLPNGKRKCRICRRASSARANAMRTAARAA